MNKKEKQLRKLIRKEAKNVLNEVRVGFKNKPDDELRDIFFCLGVAQTLVRDDPTLNHIAEITTGDEEYNLKKEIMSRDSMDMNALIREIENTVRKLWRKYD